jgi:putative DNA methylase
LEFNNQFCSFKGEGTGAVRHMFSHHILKPERLPLENSVWGASKSSGTFVSLYRSRLLHAKRYLQYPTDILLTNPSGGSKAVSSAVVVSEPLKLKVTDSWEVFCNESNSTLVLNGDSAQLPLPDRSVDAVITDPPYFDFVHYSELSDFFFAWLTLALQSELKYFARADSSHVGEVQQKSPHAFSVALGRVFSECHRVLKDDGVLTFSFHHSKVEGWSSIYQALDSTRFLVTRVYPVHAEMNVASPKSGAKNPISLDMILVCKKRGASASTRGSHASKELLRHANEIQQEGIRMSTTDKFNIEAAKCLMAASSLGKSPVEFDVLLKQTIEGD